MTRLVVGDTLWDVDGIILDKDGTLVDFDHLWCERVEQWARTLATACARASFQPISVETVAADLYAVWGYEPLGRRALFNSPLAAATLSQLVGLASEVMTRYALSLSQATEQAARTGAAIMAAPPAATEIKPLGPVRQVLERLHRAGLRLAVLTNDDTAPTRVALTRLGVAAWLSPVVGGDQAWPPKPDPAGLLSIAQAWEIAPSRLLMVGDSAADMLAGRAAGVAGCIGIAATPAQQKALADSAAVVIPSLAAVQPLSVTATHS